MFFGYTVGQTTGRGETVGDPRVALAGVLFVRTPLSSSSQDIVLESGGASRILVRSKTPNQAMQRTANRPYAYV